VKSEIGHAEEFQPDGVIGSPLGLAA